MASRAAGYCYSTRMKRTALLLFWCLLLPACKNAVRSDINLTAPQVQQERRDTVHGKEIWLAIAPLETAAQIGNGNVHAHYFEDGTTILVLQANVSLAPSGETYVAWLRNTSGAIVRLGAVQTVAKDARHHGNFEEKRDLRGYRELLLTLETNAAAETPGLVQATAVLQEPKNRL